MYDLQIITEYAGCWQWTVALCMARCINQMTLTNVVIFGAAIRWGQKTPTIHAHIHMLFYGCIVNKTLAAAHSRGILYLYFLFVRISHFLLFLLHFYAFSSCQPLQFAAITLRFPPRHFSLSDCMQQITAHNSALNLDIYCFIAFTCFVCIVVSNYQRYPLRVRRSPFACPSLAAQHTSFAMCFTLCLCVCVCVLHAMILYLSVFLFLFLL